MAFAPKQLQVQFSLANGVFQGGGNSKTLSYPTRMSAKIANAGPPAMGQLDLDVYGMTLSDMNQLTSIGKQINGVSQNTIIVLAGDVGGTLSKVFEGTIGYAWMDGQNQPQTVFRVQAYGGLYHKVAPAASTSINGSADVATTMSKLAGQMGLSFENNGVSAKLSCPYFPGSLMNQAQACAQHAGIEMDVSNDTLAIWPTNGSRSGDPVEVSAQTGMVGYPAVTQAGVIVKALFNPSLKRGGQIKITSEITAACGTWTVMNMNYHLESMVPGGAWFAEMMAQRIGYSEQP